MSKVVRFIIWICSKFTRAEIEQIISGLSDVLNSRNPDVKPKDDFKQKHPHYRDFSVDPMPPLCNPPQPQHSIPQKDYKELLKEYLSTYGKSLLPVKHRDPSKAAPAHVKCPLCNAPHEFIYYNDGKKMSQLRCREYNKNCVYYCLIWAVDKDILR